MQIGTHFWQSMSKMAFLIKIAKKIRFGGFVTQKKFLVFLIFLPQRLLMSRLLVGWPRKGYKAVEPRRQHQTTMVASANNSVSCKQSAIICGEGGRPSVATKVSRQFPSQQSNNATSGLGSQTVGRGHRVADRTGPGWPWRGRSTRRTSWPRRTSSWRTSRSGPGGDPRLSARARLFSENF